MQAFRIAKEGFQKQIREYGIVSVKAAIPSGHVYWDCLYSIQCNCDALLTGPLTEVQAQLIGEMLDYVELAVGLTTNNKALFDEFRCRNEVIKSSSGLPLDEDEPTE